MAHVQDFTWIFGHQLHVGYNRDSLNPSLCRVYVSPIELLLSGFFKHARNFTRKMYFDI